MQTFLMPQNFTDVTFNDNLQLYGLLNGNDIDQLFDDTVNKSEPAALKHVIFGRIHLNFNSIENECGSFHLNEPILYSNLC